MRNKSIFLLIVIIVLISGACSRPEPTATPTPSPPAPTATAETAPRVAAVTEATVTITNLAFQPHTQIVATGATVTWQNDDPVAHTVTSGEGLTTPNPTFPSTRSKAWAISCTMAF